MKKHFYFLYLLLLITTCCIAQKQITNFDNIADKQALNPVYQSQIGKRMIFSAYSPANGNELWVSDGTRANTKLLKDIIPGYESSYSTDFAQLGDRLYFVANGTEIWKTDGTPVGTEKLLRSESTMNLNIVAEKLLVTFRNGFTQRFSFAWLDADGQTDFLNEDATTFKYSGKNLYYGLYDSTAKKWTLKVFDSEARILATHPGPPLNDILIEKQNGYEYIAVDAGYVEKKLVVTPANRTGNAKTYDWNRGAAPLMLRDKAGALYLINDGIYSKNNLGLKVFKVIEGHNWETVGDLESSMMYAKTPTGSVEGPFHTNFVIDGDQLTFTTLFGYESIYSSYLGVFDFKKNTKRISPMLPREVTGRQVQVVPQSRDVFEIRYGYAKCIYNIAENKPVSVEMLPFGFQKVTVANKEYELSDNVYTGIGTLRLPLVNTRPIYAEKYLAHRAVLDNRLLFWTNNEAQRTGKLWVSDGKTTSELLSYEGTVISWKMATDSIRAGNQIVFTSASMQGIRIFKTDGTKAGTRELYVYPTTDWPTLDKTITNNRMAVFEFFAAGKKVGLVTDLEKVWEIDDARFEQREFRATSNDIFMVHAAVKNGMSYDMVYRFENGDLKPIELNKGGADPMSPQIFEKRIYYMLRNSNGYLNDICYTDAGSDKVNRLFNGSMTYLFRKGDCLIAGTKSGQDVKIYRGSTAELLGEFTNVQPVDVLTGNIATLLGTRQIVIVHNDNVVSQQFTEDIESTQTVPQGVLIKVRSNAGSSWYVYDQKRGKIINLFKDQSAEFTLAGLGDKLVFNDMGNNRHPILVDIANGKRVDFPAGVFVIRSLNEDLALVADPTIPSSVSVYSVAGDVPVKKYQVPGWYDALGSPLSNYTSFNTTATGFELARFDSDSLYRFPEIVKGQEGISLQEAFHFKGSVYASAFTYSKGLQVWKMDEMPLFPDHDGELVVTHPDIPDRIGNLPDNMNLNVYPNPVIDDLHIDLKEGGVIRILDPKGYELLKLTVGKTKRLDVKSLPPGQYVIIYSGANGQAVKKIVKL